MKPFVFSAFTVALLLGFAGFLFTAPWQIWLGMGVLGLVLGGVFYRDAKRLATGLMAGVVIALIRDVLLWGAAIAKLSLLIYAAAFLFALASALLMVHWRLQRVAASAESH